MADRHSFVVGQSLQLCPECFAVMSLQGPCAYCGHRPRPLVRVISGAASKSLTVIAVDRERGIVTIG